MNKAFDIDLYLKIQREEIMKRIDKFKNKFEETVQNINNTIIQQPLVIQPLQSLSFSREEFKPTTTVNPRDILLGLLNN